MSVDKNDSYFPTVYENHSDARINNGQGIPIRLEIASRLLTSFIDPLSHPVTHDYICTQALKLADVLIKKHNETCGG